MNWIECEKTTVGQMIVLYCRGNKHGEELCGDCRQLLEYAHRRLDCCKFGNEKPSCEKCPVQCYAPAFRERIRGVMRYAGPRMLFCHPIAVIRHLLRR